MKKWFPVFLIALVLALAEGFAGAQQATKVQRIGYLGLDDPSPSVFKSFRQGLAAELVQLRVDVIVTASTPAIEVVKNATSTIPIVMAASVDPVGSGLIASLDHPGGNITGLTMLSSELSGKRLELLKETVPRISRVAVLWNPTNRSSAVSWRESQLAAQGLKMQLQSIEVRGPGDFHNLSDALM